MSIAITNTDHYSNIADSVRYSKDAAAYESSLARAKAERDSIIDGSITSIESDVTNIRGYVFAYCTNMESCNLRNVTTVPSFAFYRTGLRNLYAPSAITLESSSFYQAYHVPRLFFPNVEQIGGSSFTYCKALSTIVLHKHANLQNSNILDNGCPAIIYVKPEDLSWYSTATNWSTLYAKDCIKSIEDLTGDDLVWYQEQLARYQAA